jgi:hypothetical protein
MKRLDEPGKLIKNYLAKDQHHRFLSKRKLKELYFNLEYLQNKEEAEIIKDILFQLYPEEITTQ